MDGSIARGSLVLGEYEVEGILREDAAYEWVTATDRSDWHRVTLQLLKNTISRRESPALARYFNGVKAAAVPGVLVPDRVLSGDGWSLVLVYSELPQQAMLAALNRTPSRAMEWWGQICSALATLHEHGFVHGCINPDALLAGGERAWLGSLGWMPLLELKHASLLAPEQKFLSPEVIAGQRPVPASDTYSLARTVVDWEPKLADTEWYTRATQAAPNERYQSALDLFGGLQQAFNAICWDTAAEDAALVAALSASLGRPSAGGALSPATASLAQPAFPPAPMAAVGSSLAVTVPPMAAARLDGSAPAASVRPLSRSARGLGLAILGVSLAAASMLLALSLTGGHHPRRSAGSGTASQSTVVAERSTGDSEAAASRAARTSVSHPTSPVRTTAGPRATTSGTPAAHSHYAMIQMARVPASSSNGTGEQFAGSGLPGPAAGGPTDGDPATGVAPGIQPPISDRATSTTFSFQHSPDSSTASRSGGFGTGSNGMPGRVIGRAHRRRVSNPAHALRQGGTPAVRIAPPVDVAVLPQTLGSPDVDLAPAAPRPQPPVPPATSLPGYVPAPPAAKGEPGTIGWRPGAIHNTVAQFSPGGEGGVSSGTGPFGVGPGGGIAEAPRHVVYLLDVSTSMESRIDRARAELKDALRNLRPDESFDIMLFARDTRVFSRSLVPANAETEAQADAFLDNLQLMPATDLERGMKNALRIRGVNVVILLTDGVPNLGETDTDKLTRRIQDMNRGRARIFTVGLVGKDPDGTDSSFQAGQLLRDIADENGGATRLVPLGVAEPD